MIPMWNFYNISIPAFMEPSEMYFTSQAVMKLLIFPSIAKAEWDEVQ